MDFKTTITPEFIETIKGSPLEISLPYEVSFNGNSFDSVYTERVLYPKALDYFVALAATSNCQSVYRTIDKDGQDTIWLSITRTATTDMFFEVIKKAGLYMSKLVCGWNSNTATMILSGKLCRDLARASESVRISITAYLRTLISIAQCYTYHDVEVTPGEGIFAVNINANPLNIMAELYAIEPNATFNVTSEHVDDVTVAYYAVNAVSGVRSDFAFASNLRYIATSDKDTLIAVWNVAKHVCLAVLKEHAIFVSQELYLTDIAADSVYAYLAEQYGHSVAIRVEDISNMLSGAEVMDVDDDTFTELASWAQHWVACAKNRGSSCLEYADYTLLAPLGVGTTGGITSFDRDAMRAQYTEDAYAQELYLQYKPHYDDFKLNNLEFNLAGFANGDIYSMVFVGESGTGKSTAARVIPHRCGIPYVSVNFSVNIEEADLFGAMYPNPYKKSADDPEFAWQDGIITKAVRNGYCVILEELNFARPGVLGKLNSLLDENRQIDLSNGEIVRAHPNFRIIATCNIAYEGTNRFNKALINRFDDITEFVDATREEAVEIIMSRTGYKNRYKISKVYDVYAAVKKYAKEQCVSCVVSMRQLLNIFTKGRYYINATDAVTRIMLNGAFLEDTEYLTLFKETVLPAFDLNFRI